MIGIASKTCEVTALTLAKFFSFIFTHTLFPDGSHLQESQDVECGFYTLGIVGFVEVTVGKICIWLLNPLYFLCCLYTGNTKEFSKKG